MLDVARWLADQGLGHHAEAFAENGIAGDVVRELTDADLKELGLNLGDRKRVLKAIAALPAVASAHDQRTAPRVVAREAERRQLTVMFADLVGSTELAARLDAEDMSALIRAYQNAVAGEITRFEGHIAKYMGDGVLAYFGWPQAHEDEAERAVRAGLALAQTVGRVKVPTGEVLAARVGIATGLVVVGDLVGEGAAQEEAVVGETPNLAARLQALAGPGRVVISPSTRRLVGGLFELADLGPRRLKGFAAPIRAFLVVGEGRAEGRFEALHGERLTPLVGREHERGLLLRRWEQAKEGEGQAVLLAGEPGIGKSRLTRALQGRLAREAYTRLLYFCSPYHQNSAFSPFIDQLQRAAALTRDDDEEQKLEKLQALLARSTEDLREAVPLFAALLSIPTGEGYPPLSLAPQQQKARTLDALAAQLDSLAMRQPVLMVFEDAHWADPTSLELLELVIERVRTLPVLLVITFRPEFRPPWIGQPHVTSLTLNRLSHKHGAAMVGRLTAGKALPAEVLKQIVAKADGVPLFVEEVTKTVLESGLLRDEGDHYAFLRPLPPLAIPATLHDSLTARLDRLIPVKEVAQIGAAIGREFSYELLASVSPLRQHELHGALARLEEAELVFRRGTPPLATFTFKHALVQDAAHDSLLRSKRQQIHAAIARVLEERFPEAAKMQPEVLAQHYGEAGLAEQAVDYWLRAGRRAAELSANAEAVGHLTNGLEVLKALPESRRRDELELALQSALGMPLIATRGYAAPETGAAYARARELCEQLGRTGQLLPILYGQWAYHIVGGEHRTERQFADQFLGLAEGQADRAMELVGHRILGMSLVHLGELQAGRAQIEQALALYEPERHGFLTFHFGQDQRASALAFLSVILWLAGFPDQALRSINRAVAAVEELDHVNSRGYVLIWGAATLAQLRHDVTAVREYADAVVALSEEHGLSLWRAYGKIFRGWALAEQGRQAEGMSELVRALAECRATRTRVHTPYHLSLLAEALRRFGETEEGLRVLGEALALVEETKERWWETELRRLKGDLLLSLATQNAPEAEACYNLAIATARRQGAKALELRAAVSLSRLWRNQGRRAEAHDLLAPVYGWFIEGFDTADLQDARALLDELT